MGTRGACGFIANEKLLLTYSHFDSYPDGLGADMVELAKEISNTIKEVGLEEVKANVSKVKPVGKRKPSKAIQKKYQDLGFCDLSVSDRSPEDWYCLLRNVQGAEGFREILKGNLEHLDLANNFPKDSLFCEYAYIINLDTEEIEFYKGFQKKPQEGNRFGQEKDGEYYPCKFMGSCSIHKIPRNWESKYYPQ